MDPDHFFGWKDVENMISDTCADKDIDPINFPNNVERIRASWNRALDEFVEIQSQRAVRFQEIYKALDEFDPPELFDELLETKSRKMMTRMILDVAEPITELIQKGDSYWIRHHKYVSEFFDGFLRDLKRGHLSRGEILEFFASFFELDYTHPSSDSD